jgi:hypothetical protein
MTKPIRKAEYEIGDGEKSIFRTVDYMWNYALRDAKTAEATATVKDLKGSSKIETIKNIYDWVTSNVRYKLDPEEYEMVTAPIHYLNGNRNTGDCDCMTTLLVCLLEAAGFDCAITIIQWRIAEYTHVFAEVWYDNDWFLLDPTLGSRGFGKQDKDIKKFKRITKKDMAKLVVLADGGNNAEHKIKRIPHRNCGCRGKNCCPNDNDSSNQNNININFGTNVEGSYNIPNNPKPVSMPVPVASPDFTVAKKRQQKGRPVAMCQVFKDGKMTWQRCDTISNTAELQETLENIQQQVDENNNQSNATQSNVSSANNTNDETNDVTAQISNLLPDTQVIVANGAKPKFVPQPKNRKPSYVEFP